MKNTYTVERVDGRIVTIQADSLDQGYGDWTNWYSEKESKLEIRREGGFRKGSYMETVDTVVRTLVRRIKNEYISDIAVVINE